MNEPQFWKQPPRQPMRDFRAYSLLIPACASALGFFAFSVLAYGFVELDTLSASFRTTLVLIGAFSLAFGGEVGTLSTVVEIFRKDGQAQTWDWVGLAVSVLSTLAAFVLAFAALLGARATWSAGVKLYGPIVLGVLAALDAYSGFMEFGLYLSQHDSRMEQYIATRERYDKRDYDRDRREERKEHATVAQPERTVATPEPQPEPELTPEQRRERALALWRDDPMLTQERLAQEFGVSRQTISKDWRALAQEGRAKRNGHGVVVLDGAMEAHE